MTIETKICQNCKARFFIEPEDFDFYQKISVPPPTFCWECRLQRRLAFRNERMLYRRKCDLCGKEGVARYESDARFPVYCVSCWYSDNWDPLSFGQDYDFSKPFFEQFKELSARVPRPALFVTNTVNSDYSNQCFNAKNVLLAVSAINTEDAYNVNRIDNSRGIYDVSFGQRLENCGYSTDLVACNSILFSRYVRSSMDSRFLYDSRNSNHCVACINLRNATHKIFNMQYSLENYRSEIEKLDIGSYKRFIALDERFREFASSFPRRYAMLEQCVDVVGDNVQNAKNAAACFDSWNVENCKYILAAIDGVKDCYDLNHSGLGAELCYEAMSCIGFQNKFSYAPYGQYLEYCEFCNNKASAYLFGCISIPTKKEYCIFNRQYPRQEYEKLVEKIRHHMDEMPYKDRAGIIYKYGEFFPIELSEHAYNETLAQEIFPLTKGETLQKGYAWKEPGAKNHRITLAHDKMPDHIRDTNESILSETISCAHEGTCDENCTRVFRIMPQELTFCKRFEIPLPRLCPNCRYYGRSRLRNPYRLWHRKCTCAGEKSEGGIYQNNTSHFHGVTPCPSKFETSYAPDRPEIVYCEQCYNAEVA